MSAAIPVACPAPFAARVARLRALMREWQVPLFLADHGELMAWLTGYTASETMYRAVLVPAEGPPWIVLRALDAPQVAMQGWLESTESFADTDDPFEAVAASIRARGHAAGAIAVDSASYSFSVHAQARLAAALPDVRFVCRPGVSDRLRAVKDETEIGRLREAAAIADGAMARLVSRIGAGTSSREAGAIAAHAYLELGADDGQVGRICRGAGATGFLHAELDDTPLSEGDVLHAELVPRVARYSARLMRPIAIGERPAALAAVTETLLACQSRQIAAMCAGAVVADVDALLREGVLEAGLREDYRNVSGYMLGIYARTPRSSDFSHVFAPTSDWRLEAGMVFHMYTSAQGIGVSETVLVTDAGGERLTRTPREMLLAGG